MSVEHVWVGAVTESSAWVRARIDGDEARLAVSESSDLSSPTYFGPDTATSDDMVSIRATGLDADTRYHYAIEVDDTLDTDTTGTFRTHPRQGERADFTFAMATCAGASPEYSGEGSVLAADRLSNHPVFDEIRRADPLFFAHGGDMHYYDLGSGSHGISGGGSLANYRRAYDDVLRQPRQHRLYRDVPLVYAWDDHDFGPNDSDRTASGRDNACEVYRERVPHYGLPAGSGANPIYQSFTVGRVLFLLSDVRADRDPNDDPQGQSKTMLGAAQKAWMEQVLTANTGAQAMVWLTPSQWVSEHEDSWASFLHERNELVELFGDTGWLTRMCALSGDAHALSIDTGGGNRHGNFPIYQFSALDSGGTSGPATDTGPNLSGRGHYGLVRIRDRGHTIAVAGTGYDMGSRWRAHTWYSYVGSTVFALDAAAENLGDIVDPFAPMLDDDGVRNDVAVSRQDGGEARVVDDDHVETYGRYDESATLNVNDDDQLESQAGWRVHLGTWPGMRYPAVSPALNVRPQVVEGWLDVDLGDQIEVSNLPPQHPDGTVALIAQGYAETIGPHRWDVEINTTPAGPLTIAHLPETGRVAEDFEDADLDITITDGGDEPWTRTDAEAASGEWSLRSGVITHDETSDAIVTVPTGAQAVRFWYRVSSEEDFDFFRFLVDSSEELTASGDGEWTLSDEYDVSSADTITFRYEKDGSVSENQDTAFIDDIVFTLAPDAGPDEPNRLDTSGSVLADGIDNIDTELLVLTEQDGPHDRALWITTDGPGDHLPEQFPFDVTMGGETARVTACEPFAWDDFDRTETDAWGISDSGHDWAETGGSASDREIDDGVATVTLASDPTDARFQVLDTAEVGDCDITVSVSVSATASGGSLAPSVLLRYVDNTEFYLVRIHHTSSGNVFLSLTNSTSSTHEGEIDGNEDSGFDYEGGDVFHVRVRLVGDRVLCRVWPDDGRPEPSYWQLDREVTEDTISTGRAGVAALAFAGNDNTDPELSFRELRVENPQRFTVERAVNDVDAEHDAGTAVALTQPAVIGL
ncbi:hypothetical protein F4561_006551 [Lipingzhangella halophila]|uniref:PhoD-like phosphatase metallophosphatase domain-containing protein n=1 Tax=Lipingzhangella halophila TaxID=1783352 RepID=A0A7W7RP64_9ACTN|nr:alkaline phosphatase D family protein [Lipingzhangella halophila]MBB4935642.1 hypothetical protein [Lipingzhangella halophila]